MYFYDMIINIILILLTSNTLGRLRQHGYIDKLVAIVKNSIVEDLKDLPILDMKVSLEPQPPGYKDDPSWDENSALRLLAILRAAPNTPPALRRMAHDYMNKFESRRTFSLKDSFKFFPSLAKNGNNEIYYDLTSGEEVTSENPLIDESVETTTIVIEPSDTDVIILNNPVEARLPSGYITVGLLRQILENRAEAARFMPTTKRRFTMNYTKSTKEEETTTSGNTGTDKEVTGDSTPTTSNDNGGSTGNNDNSDVTTTPSS